MGAVSIHRHEPAEAIPVLREVRRVETAAIREACSRSAPHDSTAASSMRPVGSCRQLRRERKPRPGAHYFLARIARQANDLETARREVNAAIAANPDYADAWAELGLIQTRSSQYADAEKSLAKALALDPNHYVANVNLTTLYGRTKDPRRDAQAARLKELQEKRAAQAQEFLRIIQVAP